MGRTQTGDLAISYHSMLATLPRLLNCMSLFLKTSENWLMQHRMAKQRENAACRGPPPGEMLLLLECSDALHNCCLLL